MLEYIKVALGAVLVALMYIAFPFWIYAIIPAGSELLGLAIMLMMGVLLVYCFFNQVGMVYKYESIRPIKAGQIGLGLMRVLFGFGAIGFILAAPAYWATYIILPIDSLLNEAQWYHSIFLSIPAEIIIYTIVLLATQIVMALTFSGGGWGLFELDLTEHFLDRIGTVKYKERMQLAQPIETHTKKIIYESLIAVFIGVILFNIVYAIILGNVRIENMEPKTANAILFNLKDFYGFFMYAFSLLLGVKNITLPCLVDKDVVSEPGHIPIIQ